jgi:hypothetical protein
MKSILALLDTLNDLISRAAENQAGYGKMRLIPLPVKTQERNLPNNNNQ